MAAVFTKHEGLDYAQLAIGGPHSVLIVSMRSFRLFELSADPGCAYRSATLIDEEKFLPILGHRSAELVSHVDEQEEG